MAALGRPARAEEQRSVAEIVSLLGAIFAAGATELLVPGLSGPPRPRWRRASFSVLLDLFHLCAGSVWLGGLAGLMILWAAVPAARRVTGARGLRAALLERRAVLVMLLLATGTGATIIHMPPLAALWQTSYGKSILVKIGLLAAAMVLGAVNLLRTKPRLLSKRPVDDEVRGRSAARLLRARR